MNSPKDITAKSVGKLTSTAPPRIWLQVSDDETDHNEAFPATSDEVTWAARPAVACAVGYVRNDVVERYEAALLRCAQRLKEYAEADRASATQGGGVWTDPDEFVHGAVDEVELLISERLKAR